MRQKRCHVAPCATGCRQRRTARRLGTDHHRLRSAAPPDGRRRPAASRKCQNARPQMLNHRCVQQMFFIAKSNAPSLSTNSLPKDKSQRCFFLRAVPEYSNDPPASFFAPKYVSHGPLFVVNCLILRLPILLAHLQSCSLLARVRHKYLLTAPDCAAQRASNAPPPAT